MRRLMRRLILAVVVGVMALTLAGCETSKIDSSAAVTVSGRVLRPDGAPAAGVPVGLERELSLGDALVGVFVIPLTLFTVCLADQPPELCRGRSVRRTTTAADGTYAFQLKGSDTQTSFSNARTLSVTAALPAGPGEVGGPAVTASFKVQTLLLALPDLQAWQPRVTVAAGRIGWERLDGASSYEVGVEDNGGQPVWSFESRGGEVTFDPRVLEDTAGSLAVSARSSASAEGTTVSLLRRSGRVAYRSSAGTPLSRGKPCTRGPTGTPVARCPLTDGDLANTLPVPATTSTTLAVTASTVPPVSDSATIDLGQPRNVSLVAVRGCSCEVAGSLDGQAWAALGRSTGYTAVVPSRTGSARYIRVTGVLSSLREVSVWEGAAPAPGAATTVPPSTSPANPGDETARPPAAVTPVPAPEGRSRTAPALVALALLLFVAIATAGTAVRSRR
jgi:hypothetical protein